MAQYALIRNADGWIISKGFTFDLTEIEPEPGQLVRALSESEDFDPTSVRYDAATDSFVPIPMRPSPRHEWTAGGWVDAATVEQRWEWVRSIRDGLLSRSDWVVTRATERGQPVEPDVAAYREALRDITLQADPYHIQWPAAPEWLGIAEAFLPPTEEI
jgi:hypothetical protein